MLLTIDIGNTNVKLALFDGDKILSTWRVSSEARHTADEYGMMVYDLFRQADCKFSSITGVVMSSVAPELNYTIAHMCEYYMHQKPLIVDSSIKTGLTVYYDNPKDLGADRLVGAAAAYHYYGGPVISVDFGSATTFNLVSADGTFLGGAIAPGIKTATESLVSTTAKLPRIELSKPTSLVGTDTRSCMQAGVIYGYAGMVKYLTEKYKSLPEMQGAKVIATGGLGEIVASVEPSIIDIVDRALVLKGLNYVYGINR